MNQISQRETGPLPPVAELSGALDSRELPVYIQFYVDAFTSLPVGGEAFPVWERPGRDPLPVRRAFSLSGREELSARLDDYVLDCACSVLDELWRGGKRGFFLLYRPAEATLWGQDLEARWRELLAGRHFDRRLLFLGVPQHMAARRPGAVQAIQGLHLGMVLDHFDGQVTALPRAGEPRLCGVRLDGAVTGRQQPEDALRAAVRAGHRLQLPVFAQGADTADLAVRMRAQGCDLLQGELYAPPLPAREAVRVLTEGGAAF